MASVFRLTSTIYLILLVMAVTSQNYTLLEIWTPVMLLGAGVFFGTVQHGHYNAVEDNRLLSLREDYAHDRISMLQLENGVMDALTTPLTPSQVDKMPDRICKDCGGYAPFMTPWEGRCSACDSSWRYHRNTGKVVNA